MRRQRGRDRDPRRAHRATSVGGLLAAALLAALAAGFSGREEEPPPRPNVIVLLVDTLRAQNLGAYGYARPTSPRFDALAAESFLFE